MINHTDGRALLPQQRCANRRVRSAFIGLIAAVFLFGAPAMAAPQPQVSLDVPDTTPFIGSGLSFDVVFDNTGPDGDTGYGPFIDVIIPSRGADGDPGLGEPLDGIDFVSASYAGLPVQTTVLTFPDDDGAGPGITGCLDHPLARDSNGDPLEVCGLAGDTLLVVRLPFGSFVTDQPPARVTINANVSNLADVGEPLTIHARGGFQFGADPLNNPTVDPSIVSQGAVDSTAWSPSQDVTPQIVTVEKTAPSGLTGPNYPRSYQITVEIAPGQEIDGLAIVDTLPSDVVYISATASSGTVVAEPLVGEVVNPAANEVRVELPPGATGVVTLDIAYFVPEADFDGIPTINRDSAAGQASQPNAVTVDGDWSDPIDPRDDGGPFSITVDNVTRQDTAIELIKTASMEGGATPSPGAIVRYTLQLRVSDYFAFDDLTIDDVLGDGHRWFTDGTRVPTLALSGHQGVLAADEFDAGNYVITPQYSAFGDDDSGDGSEDGTTEILFNVSAELSRRGQAGQLLGGCFPNGTGGNGVADCDRVGNAQLEDADAASLLTIVFYAQIQEYFSDDFPSGNQAVVQGDTLSNSATVDGRVLNDETLSPTGFRQGDTDGDSVQVPVGSLSKTVYRINNNPPGSPVLVRPGDEVTYRLTYELPTHNFEQFLLIDYLPLPIFAATELTNFVDVVSADAPPAGSVKFGPADTFRQFLDVNNLDLPINGLRVPNLVTNASGNTLSLEWGDFETDDSVPDSAETVDILLTVTVSNDPFADGLQLTNLAEARESTTSQEASTANGVVQVTLEEPELEITKGISASSNGNSSLAPDPVGDDPVDSNLLDADAGDRVSFAITLENVGSAPAFDIAVWDNQPAGLVNCRDVDVDGASASGGDLFDSGNPLLLDSIPENAQAVITYDCDIDAGVNPRQQIDNTATANWKALAGAAESFPDIQDDASISIAEPTLSKTSINIDPGPAGGSVVPGDVISYELTVTLPEGTTPGLTIEDSLPAGFSYVSGTVAVNSTGFDGSITTVPPSESGPPGQPVFDFGAVTVDASTGTVNNSFVVTYDVLVLDDPANSAPNSPQNKTNTATLDYTGNPGSGISDSHTVEFREPVLDIAKGISPSSNLQAGQTVTVTLTLQNTGTAPALDITVEDLLDASVFDTTSVSIVATPVGFDNTSSGSTVSWESTEALGAGQLRTFTFDVPLNENILTGSEFENTATTVGFSQDDGVSDRRQTADNGSANLDTQVVAASKVVASGSEPSSNSTATPGQGLIGEIISYELRFTMPAGVTQDGSGADNAIIRDILPAGLVYLSGTAEIEASAGTLSGAEYGAIPTTETGIDPDAAFAVVGNELRFNLGDITNSADGSEQIIIRFDALVENVAGNTLGTVLTNTGRLTYLDADNDVTNIDATHDLRVIEPQFVSFNKTADPQTGQAGDTIDFEVVFQASSAADTNTNTAFDVVMRDQLPADMALDESTVSVAFAPAACSTVSANNSDDDPAVRLVELVFDSIPQGCQITVSYQADLLVSVAPGDTITNDAELAWTSLPGPNGTTGFTPGAPGDADGERTGSGGVNSYFDNTSADVEIEPGELAKVVVDTSNAFTADDRVRAGVDDLAIGETATFHITATIPFGTTSAVTIVDTLPHVNGVMEVESAQVISVGSNLDEQNNPPVITITDEQLADGVDDTVSFEFGQIINDPNTYSGDQEDIQIVVEVVGLLLDIASNENEDQLTNNALVQFGPGLDASASAPVDVVEPFLNLNKSGNISTGQGGDVVTFTLTLNHTSASNADAHDVVLIDNLPTGMALVASSLSQTSGPAADTLDETANGIDVRWDRLALGETVVLEFQAELTIDAVSGQTVTNTSNVDWTSMPGSPAEERAYDTSDSHGVMITEPGVSKVVASTSNPDTGSDQFGPIVPDLTIGEEVTYTVTVELPKGTSRDVQVVDTLPNGSVAFEIVSSELTTVGANISGVSAGVAGTPNVDNNQVTWNLGDLTNDPSGAAGPGDLLTFEVVAVVMDDALNQSGATNLLNTATLTTDSTGPSSATAPVDLVAPTVAVEKTVTNPADGFVEGDQLVDYTLEIRHTGVSTAPAYNLVLTDTLPADIAWEDDTSVSSTCPGFSFDSTADPVIVFEINRLLLDDGPDNNGRCSISFQGRTAPDVQPNQSLVNAVSVDYDSMPNNDSGQNRTRSDSDTASVTVNAPGMVKEVFATSLAGTGMSQHDPSLVDLAIGEEVTYQITVTFPEGVTNDALIVDMLPVDGANNARLEAIGGSVVSLGGQISTSMPGTPLFSDASGDGVDDTVSFDFGTVTNVPDGVTDAGDRVVVQVVARVTDIPANSDADVLVNESTFSFDGGSTSDTAEVEIVEPDLAVSKSMALAGDGAVTITLAVTNSGTAPAYNVNVSDVLDEAVWDLDALSFGAVSGGFELDLEPGPGAGERTLSLRSTGSNSIAVGGSASGQFTVPLAVLPPVTNPVFNQADLTTACSLPGGCEPGQPGREQDPDNDDATIGVPDLSVDKTAALQVDADGSGDVSPGDTLRYTLTIRNEGAAAATNLLLVDTPDIHTVLENGSVTTSVGTVLEGNNPGDGVIRVSVPSLAASADVVIQYDVVINNPLPAGVEQVVNQALLSSDELPDVLSDDPDEPGDQDETIEPVNAAPDLVLVKSDGGVTAVPGGGLVYSLSYENVGNQDATGVVISDTVPANTLFDAAGSDPAWVCLPDGSAGSSCALEIGDLDAGDAGSVSFAVVVNNPLPDGVTSVVNTAVIADDGSNGPDPTPDNNSDEETTPINVAPALAISKVLLSANPDPVVVGSELVYRIQVSNTGNSDLSGVTISDPLVDPIDLNSCSWDSSVGFLAIGESVTCEVSYQVTVADVGNGQVVNIATADSDQTTPVTDDEIVSIANTPAIRLQKTVTSGAPFENVGDVINYQLVATNIGNAQLLDVVITDAGATIDSCVPTQPAVLDLTETLVCQASYSVTQTDIDNGSYTNAASVSGEDAVGTVVSDDDQVTVGGPGAGPDMTLVKQADTAGPVDVGDVINYTLTTSNTGNVTLFGVVVVDDLITLDCTPAIPADLNPAEQIVCTGSYTVTAADVDAQQPIVNNATASGTDPDGNTIERDDSTDTPVRNPELTLIDSASFCRQDGAFISWQAEAVGSGDPNLTIRWIANDGSGDVVEELTDQPLTGELPWPGIELDADGNAINWPGWEQDADGNWFEVPTRVRPEVEVEFQLNPTVSQVFSYPAPDTACRTEPPLPAIDLVKDAEPVDVNNNGVLEPGEFIDYTLTTTNVGNVVLNDVVVVDDLIDLDCTPVQPLTLAPGEQVICTGRYQVQNSDIGRAVVNQASVSGSSDVGDVVEDDDQASTVTGPPPLIPVAGPFGLALLTLMMLLLAGFQLRQSAGGRH